VKTFAISLCLALLLPSKVQATSIAPQFWKQTRMASVVAVGTAQRQGNQITFSVSRILKGEPGAKTLTFPPKERVQSTSSSEEIPVYYIGPPEGFEKGEPCIVFLRSVGEGAARRITLLHAFLEHAEFEENVKDVVRLDALPDEDSKCRLLVNFVIKGGASQYYARDELIQNYDKEGYLDLFEEIAADPESRSWFVQLLCQIEGKKALARMMQVLESDPPDMQLIAIAALSQLDKGNDEVSKALVPFLKHEDPMIRAQAVVALHERKFYEVSPQIVETLSDSNAQVRGAAAGWPWHDESLQTPETIRQLRKMTDDNEEWVRFSAGSTLIKAGDVASFYSLWWQSLTDSEYVRRSLPLRTLVERRPVPTFLLLIWPTALSWIIAVRSRKRREVRLAAWPLGAILTGFLIGAVVGYCLGEYRATDPLLHALFLTPAITVPLCLIASTVLATVRGKGKPRETTGVEAAAQG
jgi:hypothetical protein